MSINIPPSLGWVANLAVGDSWPKADEDKLRALGQAWEEAAQEMAAINREVGPSVSGVLAGVAGPVLQEFVDFVEKFMQNLPQMAQSADQLARMAKKTAVEVQYAKYMILLQLAWMAFEIAQWILYAPAVLPAIVTAGRLAVRMIVRRLLVSMAMGIGLMVGMDAAIQGLQMLMGNRTEWNTQATLSAVASGAVGGAIGGATFGLAAAFLPRPAQTLIGKLITGGITGIATTVAQDALLGGHSGIASAFTSGMMEGLSGGGRRFRWQKPEGMDVNPPNVNIPQLPGMPDLDLLQPQPGGPGGGGWKSPESLGGGGTSATNTLGGNGTVTESGGPSTAAPTTAGNDSPGTQGTDGSTGAATAPVSTAGAPSAPGSNQNAGSRPGDGNGADRPQRQPDEQDDRPVRQSANQQLNETMTLPPGIPTNNASGAAPTRPAQGLPGFDTTLVTPSGSNATAPDVNTGAAPVAAPATTPVASGNNGQQNAPAPTTAARPGTAADAAEPARTTTTQSPAPQDQAPTQLRPATVGDGAAPAASQDLTPPQTVPTATPSTVPAGTVSTGTGGTGAGTGTVPSSTGPTGTGTAESRAPETRIPTSGAPRETAGPQADQAPVPQTDRQIREQLAEQQETAAIHEDLVRRFEALRSEDHDTTSSGPSVPDTEAGTGQITGTGQLPGPREASSPVPAEGRVRVPAEDSEGAGRHRIAVAEGTSAGSAANARPPGDQRPVTGTGAGSGSRGDRAGGGTGLESALPQDETRVEGQGPAGGNAAAPDTAAIPSIGTAPDTTVDPSVGTAPDTAVDPSVGTAPDTADGSAPDTAADPGIATGHDTADMAAGESGTGSAGDDGAGLQAIHDLPQAPAAFDPAQLPDPSPQALLPGLPAAPGEAIAALGPQVQRSVSELSGIARGAGLPEAGWRQEADAAREAARTGNWGETARRLEALRTAVEHGLLDRRLAEFRSHVGGGFARLEELGVGENAWRAKVDAVEQAARTGDVVLADSALREYTAFVERHLPVEVLNRTDTPGSFDAGVEQLRRELTAVGDPVERQRLQEELAVHRQLRERLDRLAQADPEASLMLRRTLEQEEAARTAGEAARARQALEEYQRDREMQRRLDEVREGAGIEDLDRRFDALREAATPDPRGQELRQRVEDAATPEEREQALAELAAHHQLTADERRLNALREVAEPEGGASEAAAQRARLVQQLVDARTPQERDQAAQAWTDFTLRQEQQAQDAAVRRRLDALDGGVPQDPREAELRRRLDDATTEEERTRALHELAGHKQAQLQQRVDNATTDRERTKALDEQAAFNNWTPQERQLAELRTGLLPGGAPEADARRAELMREIENARSPEESRRAEQALTEHTDRRIREQQQRLAERQQTAEIHNDLERRLKVLRGQDPDAAPAHDDPLLRRFEELRGDGTQQDPREAELMRGMESAANREEAATARQALQDYLSTRERQRQEQEQEQERLARVQAQEQEVASLREQLTRQQRTGALDDAAETRQRLEEAHARLDELRTEDEIRAALRRELQQEIDLAEQGADSSGSGSGSGGRLDRLVEEGLAARAEQERARIREELEYLRRDVDAGSLDELDALPSVSGTRPEELPDAPAAGNDGEPQARDVDEGSLDELDALPSVPGTRPEKQPEVSAAGNDGEPEGSVARAEDATSPEVVSGAEDVPGARPGGEDDAAAGFLAGLEDMPSAPLSPLARFGDVAGPRPAGSPGQSGPPPGRQAPGQLGDLEAQRPERSGPAVEGDDSALPEAPSGAARVDRATMPERVPRVEDLERTIAALENDTVAARPADEASTPPAESNDVQPEGARMDAATVADPATVPGRSPVEDLENTLAEPGNDTVAARPADEASTPPAESNDVQPEGARTDAATVADPATVPGRSPVEDRLRTPVTPELRRFAERLAEPGQEAVARRLWSEAAKITQRHNPFPVTLGEGAASLRQRDPEQYWNVMRVAQALHAFENSPDRIERAVAEARVLAEQRGVSREVHGILAGDDYEERELGTGPAAYHPVDDARQALRRHLATQHDAAGPSSLMEGPSSERDFDVVEREGGHEVVYRPLGVRTEFSGPEHEVVYRETAPVLGPAELRRIKIAVSFTPTEQGGRAARYELLGPSDATGRFEVGAAPEELRTHRQADFSVLDRDSGVRLHYAADGSLVARDQPLADGSGQVRLDMVQPSTAPRFLSQRLTPLTGDLPGPLRGLQVHTAYTADGTGGPVAVHQLTDPAGNPATATAGPLPPSLTGHLPDGFTLTDPATGHGWHFDAWGRLRYHDTPAPAGVVLRADAHAPDLPPQYLIPATLLPAWPHHPHTQYRLPAPHGLQIRATAHPGDTAAPATWALDLLAPHGQPATDHALLFDGAQLHLTDSTGHTQPLPALGAPAGSDPVTGAPPVGQDADPFGIDLDLDLIQSDLDWLDGPLHLPDSTGHSQPLPLPAVGVPAASDPVTGAPPAGQDADPFGMDLDLTGFDPGRLDGPLRLPDSTGHSQPLPTLGVPAASDPATGAPPAGQDADPFGMDLDLTGSDPGRLDGPLRLPDSTGHSQPLPLPAVGAPAASDPATGAPPAGQDADPFGMDLDLTGFDLTGFDSDWLDIPSPGRPGEPAIPPVGDSGAEAAGPYSGGLPASGSGDRIPGPPGEGTADGAPGRSQPDQPAPPPAARLPHADRAAAAEILRGLLNQAAVGILRGLLNQLENHNHGPAELARRLLISEKHLTNLLDGRGLGDWLPRLRVLEVIAPVQADWRLVRMPTVSGFAVAVRRGQEIAHFHPDGTFSHSAMVLPGTGHRLELEGPEGTARLVKADGTIEIPAVSTDDRGELRVVSQADGEWWVDGAARAVRRYQRASRAADPARQLSDWADNPGEPALDDWKQSLKDIKETRGLSEQQDVARLLGVTGPKLPGLMRNPNAGFKWRVRVAAYLTSQSIGNWSIKTVKGTDSPFDVVFGTGTTLRFLEGKVVAWTVGLPGADLRVHYDQSGTGKSGTGKSGTGKSGTGKSGTGKSGTGKSGEPRLKTLDGKKRPPGWKLVKDGGGVTVSRVAAAGGSQWRVSAQRTLDSFTLPPADPAPDAGALPPAPRREPEPMEATATAPHSDLPVGSSSAPQMPGTAAESDPGPSYLPLTDTTGHTQPLPALSTPPASDPATAAPPASQSTDPLDIDLTGLDAGRLDIPSPGRAGEPAIPPVGDSGAEAAGPYSGGLPDGGSGDRIPGPPGEGTADGAPAPSQPDQPALPPAARLPHADRAAAAKILRGLLDWLKNPSMAELARRLLTTAETVEALRDGRRVRGDWLPRLTVLDRVAPMEADWRLVPTTHSGFAVAMRREQDIAHFHPHGTFSHWAMTLPGTGHRLELKGPEGTARLVDADGTEIQADISTDGRGELHVHHKDRGEWWVDGAEHVVRGYQRTAGVPDPARQLSDWSHNPGKPALDDWEQSLEKIKEKIKEKHDRTHQNAVAGLLGLYRESFFKLMANPNAGFQGRVRVAAYLTTQETIGNWSIESIPGTGSPFRVVFGAGTTLHFRDGNVVAWKVSLPSADLRVHYDPLGTDQSGTDQSGTDQSGTPRLETLDGKKPPGWELVKDGGGFTVSRQGAAAGAPEWRVTAQRTLESFTLPSADPTNLSLFRRLTNAGALPRDVLGGVPGPAEPDRPAPPPAAGLPDAHRAAADGAELAVRGYQRAPDAQDPARLLSDWARDVDRLALDNWRDSLNAFKETHRLSEEDLERLLGLHKIAFTMPRIHPSSGVKWRVGIAIYLTSQNIGNWSIETITGSGAFHVVFGAGTTLRFRDGNVVAWAVSLPGAGLRVHYNQSDPPWLATLDGRQPPPGWELRVEPDGAVTVSQAAAAGGAQWHVSAQRTLDSVTLPPADPANPSPFRRLTDAGALPPAPRREPEPMEATATAPDTDLPVGSSAAPLYGTAAESNAGPSYLDTVTWSDTSPP